MKSCNNETSFLYNLMTAQLCIIWQKEDSVAVQDGQITKISSTTCRDTSSFKSDEKRKSSEIPRRLIVSLKMFQV